MARILGYLQIVCAQVNDIPKSSEVQLSKGVLCGPAGSAVPGVSVTNEGYDVVIQILTK